MFCVVIRREISEVVSGGSGWLRCDGGSIDRSDSWAAYVVADGVVRVLAGVGVGGGGDVLSLRCCMLVCWGWWHGAWWGGVAE